MTGSAGKLCAALVASLSLALAFSACGGGDEEPETTTAASTTSTTTTAEPPAGDEDEPPTADEPPADGVALYFTRGEQFRKVDRDLPADGSERSLRVTTEALLDGPTKAEAPAQTAIPVAVELEDLSLAANGTATVEVSARFAIGAGRGERAEQEINARVGQLTYTLTQFDGVRAVKVLAGGDAVEAAVARAAYVKPARGPVRVERPKGAKSASTRGVQERLVRLHYLPKGAVDGVAGYQTEQAVIAFQSWEGLARDGVVGPQTKAALASARRPRPRASGPPKRIEVYREKGVALLIDHGNVKRAIHVSTGAPGTATPSGTYEVFRKELQSWSVPFQVWLPYASYFTGGIAFHEYPDVPTFPASHGCVRVPAPEAKGLYGFASVGTTIVVY